MQSTSVQKLKILRILRLLRLFKLLRIIRSGRVFSRLEDIMDIGYAMITLFKFIFGTLAIAHWMACAWMLCQIIEESCKNWVVSYFDAPLSPDGEPLDYCDRVPVDVCLDMFPGNCQPDESCEDGCGFYWEVSCLSPPPPALQTCAGDANGRCLGAC